MIDIWQEIYSTIKRNKLRTFLTGFAVAWGIFMLIVLLGAGNGLIHAFEQSASERAMNSIKIFPGWTSKSYDGLKEGRRVQLIVTLGDKLFYGTGLSPCFLILRRMKPAAHSGRILMIDGTKILTQRRAQNVLEPADVDKLYALYKQYEDVEDFSKVVTLQEVREKDYNLSPNRFVEYHKEEIRPYSEVLAEFKQAYEDVKRLELEFSQLINA